MSHKQALIQYSNMCADSKCVNLKIQPIAGLGNRVFYEDQSRINKGYDADIHGSGKP